MKKKNPFHLLFSNGLKKICKHPGHHTRWGYQIGSGVTELYCSKCGEIVKRVVLDDLPLKQLKKVIKLLRDVDPPA